MAKVQVQAGQSLLESYVKSPATGLCELVWNAFDEDAKVVRVVTELNDLGGIDRVIVSDDGNGMNADRAQLAFSRVGDSWKMMPGTKSSSGTRPVHGRFGRGRYSAFAIGDQVRWTSSSEAVRGGLATIVVSGSRSTLDTFDISEVAHVGETAGTSVSITQISDEGVKAFDAPSHLRTRLLTEFALHLQRYENFSLEFLGSPVDPTTVIKSEVVLPLPAVEGVVGAVSLTVIEWELDDVRRAIYLCDAQDRVVDEVDARIQAPGLEFTAYLKWEGFSAKDPVALEDDMDTPRGRLIAAAREALKDHAADALRHREAETVKRWRSEGVYPYKEDPKTPIERAKKTAFDVIALAASRTVDESRTTQSKALALSLLKQAVENDPESLLPILHEVARLPKSRIEELAQILEHTSLTQLIQTGREVGSRLDFLTGLNTILFDRQIKPRLLERRQLHRILVHETWIFGEEWGLTGDDERLTAVLKKFLSKLGTEVDLASLKPVLREDGSDAIPDLVLGRQLRTAADRYEHLVVELKRPKHKLTDEDVSQLRSYASAITNDEMFDQPNVTWDFWLVGNELTTTVDEQRRSSVLPFGVVQQTAKYRLVVKTWAEVISDNRHRLKFVQESLQYETSQDQGLAYLRERYAEYLPAEALPTVAEDRVQVEATS
jgi:hypothetical protein